MLVYAHLVFIDLQLNSSDGGVVVENGHLVKVGGEMGFFCET